MRTQYIVDKAMQQVLGILMPQNRLVMEVMLHTGLRVGDVLALRPEQLGRRFTVVEQKTGKRRRVSLTEPLLSALRRNSGAYWVFPGRLDEKRHRTRQAVWKDVKRAARAYRIKANVGTHTARKKFAVELLARYGDLERVRKALNHDRLDVTMLYACADTLLRAENKARRSR